MRQTRAELTAHLGGAPSITQRALIERATQLTIRLAVMDAKFADTGAQSEHDSRTYLAWSAALARLLRQIGLARARARVPSIADIMAGTAP